MEFSLFLVLLALSGSVLVLMMNGILEAAEKWKVVRYGSLILPAAVFFFSQSTAVLLLIVLLMFLAGKDTKLLNDKRTMVLTLFFLALLAGLSLIYYRQIVQIWIAINDLIIKALVPVPLLRNSRLVDVFFVAQYFRFLYPVLFCVMLFFLFDRILSGNPRSYWHRFFRKFDHRIAYPMTFFWALYFVLDWAKPMWPTPGVWLNLALEAAVYFSMLYAVYGTLTVMIALRKIRVPLFWSMTVLLLIVVVSGPVFLFTLTFLMGIGVSDIWMHYNKKRLKKIFSK